MQTNGSVIQFPKQSKPTGKKKPKDKTEPQPKATVLEWIRNGFRFPGKVAPPDKPQPKPMRDGR